MTGQGKKIALVLLVDWQLGPVKFWLQEKLGNEGFEVSIIGIPNYSMRNRTVKWRKLILWWQYFRLGKEGARLARQLDGIVVGWNFIAGAFAALFMPKKSKRVISLNMIAHDKGVVNHFLRSWIYNRGFSAERMIATVNSEELRDLYLKSFKIRPDQLYVLHDCWAPTYEQRKPSVEGEDYVFSGGEAARDWDSLLKVARKLSEVKFEVVARKMNWPSNRDVPPNVQVFFDLDETSFYAMVKKSRLVLLPLKGKVTAGLIVLIRAILLGKLVVTTDVAATKSYYPECATDLLVPEGDPMKLSLVTQRYYSNTDLRIDKAFAVQNFTLANHSPEAFARRVGELVQMISKAS